MATAKRAPTKTKATNTRRRRATDKAAKLHGIGDYVSGMLIKGKSSEAILDAVHKHFPNAKTSNASIAWYRAQLKRQGKL